MTLMYENIRLAFFGLKANKMRALLTMLGIIIGIASVIAIMTVGNSMTSMVTDEMASIGANHITVGLQQKSTNAETTEEGLDFTEDSREKLPAREDYFTKEMLENYCQTYAESVNALSAVETVGSGQILDGNLYANVSVKGVSLGYFIANDLTLLEGRYFATRETQEAGKVAIVSDRAVDNLFDGDRNAAIGSSIQANVGDRYFEYTVIGIYEYEESMMGFSASSDKDMVTDIYIPLRTAQKTNHTDGYLQFTVVAFPGVDTEKFCKTTEDFFNTYYRSHRDFAASAFSMSSIVESMREMLSTITLSISVIAGIALLVGGIGVMNIMLVSITERTREIGTRKALGAPNSSIRMQFIVESVVICMIGGVIGIILGVVMGSAMAAFLDATAVPSVSSIVVSLLFSTGIGIFFGYYPANKAAKMDPIEALRYE